MATAAEIAGVGMQRWTIKTAVMDFAGVDNDGGNRRGGQWRSGNAGVIDTEFML